MTPGRWAWAALSAATLAIVGGVYLTGPDEVERPGPVVVSVPTTSTTPQLPPCVVDGDCWLNGRP